MIADSSSRLQRGGTGSSLATALRDRGPCVIPVQPNRSLPIRPAPPTPTRSAASIVTLRKTRSPILKLSKSASLDMVELQSNVSPSISSLTNELNEFPFGQQDGNGDGMMLTSEFIDRSDYILPDMTNVVQIAKEVNSVKRKNGEDQDKEYDKEITKDVKKRRKSHEVDAGHIRDERVKNILKEYSRTCSGNLADKGERKLQQHVVVRLWDDKRYSSPVVVSTTEPETEKKEVCNKVVPPLRLKKVVREASTTDEYRRNIEMNAETGNESNYRIVTGATPRPESPSGYSAFWSNVASEKELESSTGNARDKSRRFAPKSDGYKIKYRRNRLRQKLRELRGKALELSREMTACNNAADTSPQRSTRLRQMMNCYEKQIENISKLLCKLSASIPPTTDDVVDLDYENELNERMSVEKTAVESDVAQVNGISRSSVSPSPSPPKLSPRSPIDYEKGKSPDAMRNSPPVLPRVYIAIQPSALECLKKNLAVVKSWHKGDSSLGSPIQKEVKVNDTDQTIIRDDVIAPALSPVSSSEFEDPRNSTAEWHEEEPLPKLKNPEIEEKIPEDTKTFGDIEEHRQTSPTIPSDSFLDSTMDIEIDGSDMPDTKEVAQGHLDEVTQASEIVANKQVACEKQELEQKSSEALPANPSIMEETRKTTEYGTYSSEERINGKNRVVTSTVMAAQEASTIIGRPQVPAANVTNIVQLQSNYYGPSVARENVVFTDVIQNSRDVQKVMSSINQSTALDPIIPLGFAQSRSTVSSSNQQCIVLPNSCNKAQESTTSQRNDGSRIMTEQFPTLGNWVARMSKKQAAKSKSKLQSGISLPTASTAEATRIPGLETQKIRSSASSNATRNNIVNVAPQWNTERWQRQQHQQRQQQLYASSAAPPVRPGICPPISVTQFYPSNYAIDPYGAAFGYHSAVCPYGDYPYHSRLHATAPPISGYQIGPLQDPHASSLRQMQHLDKRYPAHLQDTASRHFTTDLLKYSGTLSAGGYQPAAAAAAAAAAAGLDYDRLRTATAATQNGTASACLPPLLLPPPPPLAAPAQQSLARTSLAGYPASNGQCGRNRMIPDVVAAAAAAAVVAAASFGRQRGTLPSYGRTDTEMVPGGIGGVMDNESSQLIATNRVANRERLPQEQVQPSVGGVNVDSRLNNGGYRQLQNLLLDRLPYVKADDAYSQSSTAIFDDNAQEPTAASSAPPTSTYKPATILPSSSALAAKEPARKENRNCETPHLGKVNRTQETTSNLECSNCGLTGSMFKCLGCETAFYCDERCQTRHWNIHVEKCPKRMPKLKKLI
ncbi:PREDICTED: uncharacterized protein LOC105453590 isoform X1 [Wasmannia auropunctata]|nr:PREDICTED: uncharacterized protein LOC105453590 isoform X1 [Wasmannia auropunctata]